jgi:hypothetical protein
MNNAEMKAKISALYESGDAEAASRAQYEMAADDYVQEWPQSGERIRGRDNALAINTNYPSMPGGHTPHASLRRVLEPGEAWVIEGTIDYGDGVPVSSVSIVEMRDGKVVRQTDYFANPFPAPEWRRQWVERMEPAPAPRR